MAKYVALLRGINVGGRIIKMADLRACFESMGFLGAQTILQSGNVIFESGLDTGRLKQKVEAGLTGTFRYPAKVQVVPIDRLREIVAGNPFAGAPDEYHQYVIFFEAGLEKDFCAEAAGIEDEEVRTGHSVAYWKVEKGMTLKSQRGKLLSKPKYRDFHTNRNVNTLRKLLDKAT